MLQRFYRFITPGNRSILIFLFSLPFITLACLSFNEKVNPKKEEASAISFQAKQVVEGTNFTNAPIILPKENTPLMVDAAEELADYIQKICGKKPEIIEGAPSAIPSKAIWVGYQPAIEKLFPGISFKYEYPEEIINVANEKYIAITGRDRWDPKNMTIPDRTGKNVITGVQQEYGTCNAVYTFIQDQLQVRWLWPGPLGEDIIKNDELIVPAFFYRYHPQIRDRSGMLHLLRLVSNKGAKGEHRWARLQRMQLSSFVLNPSHAFKDWWKKYGKTNPEFFALLPDGRREPKYSPSDVKICQSNPKVWDQWLKEVEDQLKANPTQTVFSAASNDGWSQGNCTCTECRAWDAPGFSWSKPILSDRDVTFANTLAAKLKAKYPGKNYYVHIMGYGYSRPAPVKAIPSENVVVSSVANFLQRGDGYEDDRTLSMKQYSDWGKVTKNLGWRPNIGNPAGQTVGMPDVAPHQASEDFKFIARSGCIGLFFDSYWNHWATQGIQYYALAQLAWNPALNIDSLLDDYYLRAYGPAANEMKTYWKLMEDTRNNFVAKVKTRGRFAAATDYYTENWFSEAEKIIGKAKAKADKSDARYMERINYSEGGLAYAKLLMDTRRKVEIFEDNRSDPNIKKEIDANWAKAKAMKTSLAPYSINFNKVFTHTKSLGGFHYDSPLGKKAQKQLAGAEGYE